MKSLIFFINNNIAPRNGCMNGLVLTKNIIDKLFEYYDKIKNILEFKLNWCNNEIIIPSIIFKEFRFKVKIIGVYFKDGMTAIQIDKKSKYNMYTIKPIRKNDNKLLDYIHREYMDKLYNEFLNNNVKLEDNNNDN
jgi:hypothetical protein